MDRLTQRSALGQKVPLGTYYNAKSDSFMSASFLKTDLPSDAIQITDIQKVKIKVGYEDVYEKQFEIMDIGDGLGVSILAGLTCLKGSSVYLYERPSSRALHAALHYTVTTFRKTLSFSVLKDCLARNEIPIGEATHVVAAIESGLQSIVSARQYLGPNTKVKVAKCQFEAEFVRFQSAVENLHSVEQHNVNQQTMEQTQAPMEITAYSDIFENEGILMKDFREAYEFLRLMPLCIKSENGEGWPIMYSLLPIEMLSFFFPDLKVFATDRPTIPATDCLRDFIQLFSELQTCQRNLDALETKVLANQRYLPPSVPRLIRDRQRGCGNAIKTSKLQLARTLQAVRNGSNPTILAQLLAEYQRGEWSPGRLANVGAPFERSIEFVSRAVANGAVYIGYNGLRLDEVLPKSSDSEAYVLFFSPSAINDSTSWPANYDLLCELLRNRDSKSLIAIADCEAISCTLDKVCIAHYRGGKEITDDFLEYKGYMAEKCFAECNEETLETENIQKPIQRRHVTIPCPGSSCTVAEVREWICPRCETPIEYGFSDQYIYCDCGRSLYSNYVFKCNSDSHGLLSVPWDRPQLLGLLQGLIQSNYLNILILGETGVGKSTFINALVNYLEFETLDDAIDAEKLNYVIPCSFSTQIMDRTDPDRPIEEKRIKIGARDDEKDGSSGDSATQRTTVYPVTFNMGNSTLTVRLIDTPGMGDTRGVDYDRQNMADILSTLSSYEELHGILILLKSNAARLTVTFSYCIKELLTHLHHNAARNIAFGFTNTRISNYTPGDTYGPLQALLRQHPGIGVKLSTSTTYCFDSESFRYLAAFKKDVPMPNKEDFDRSWKHSRDESIRLIGHFKANPPHKIRNTLSLNGARQIISELTKPMAEISQVIQANIAMTEDKMQELKDTRLSGDQLRNRLFVQQVQMNAVPLDKPRTVCGNGRCTEVKDDGNVGNKSVTIYKLHCHPVCSLTDVQADQIAHPGLIRCEAFSGSDRCRRCRHHWQEHLHVLYELVEETVTAVDSAIEQKLKDHANDVTLRETALTQHERRIAQYKKEREIIRDAAAKFGVFLRKNSLAPYNDALIAYLDYLIKEEQIKVQVGGNDKRLRSLTEERHKHTEAIEIITRDMNSMKAQRNDLSEAAIESLVQKLYSLEHSGITLRNLKQGIATAHQATYREMPYTVRRRTPRRLVDTASAQGQGPNTAPAAMQNSFFSSIIRKIMH